MNAPVRMLVDILLEEGAVDRDTLREAHEASQETGVPIGRVLVSEGHITEAQLVRALALQVGMEFFDFTDFTPDKHALGCLNGQIAKRHTVVPARLEGDRLIVAMADPGNVVALDELRGASGKQIIPAVATRADLVQAIAKFYRADSELTALSSKLSDAHAKMGEQGKGSHDLLSGVDSDAPVVKYVNVIINQAISDRASDIHIEPGEDEMRVRYRIDGVLHDVMSSPAALAPGVISRLKVMAEMDIAEKRKPQDGRISVSTEHGSMDLRVAALPTVWGEKIVMRILDNSTASMSLDSLGFTPENYARYEESFRKPYGMILVTGPTGSGKSTTLYATLNIVSRPEINVITVEDPVEYRIAGINQVQVNPKAGLTFASALRSILRADPDVVLIGEIRDAETAQIAVEAALTGHLVLSTLHTNDAGSAVVRLTEMGIEPFLVGSAVDSVVAQRLARRLCDKCKEDYDADPQDLIRAGFPWELEGVDLPPLCRPVGCSVCSNTGYKGRLAIHEVMQVSEEIERLAIDRAATTTIINQARGEGMATLKEDGWLKVLQGLTSIEELLRVVA